MSAASFLRARRIVADVFMTVFFRQLCGQYGITGYPSLHLFQDGKVEAYHGERTEAALVAFATATTPAAPFTLSPAEAVGDAPAAGERKAPVAESKVPFRNTTDGGLIVFFVFRPSSDFARSADRESSRT